MIAGTFKRQAALRRAARSAFTLPEVMIALAILVLVIFSVTGFLGWLCRAVSFAENMTRGTALAQEKLEELVGQDYAAITGGTDSVARFTRTWTVTESGGLKRIGVTVNWQNVQGAARHLSVATAVSR
ncbi:MAG: prepilin-type N-terminal cleavage/methylation domain-containing protein [Kiritimatiellae bacterium]|nr:prepilin-type N-terminal cleavage/methylation domain-containing protein [Kiritimatiellia bacterium]